MNRFTLKTKSAITRSAPLSRKGLTALLLLSAPLSSCEHIERIAPHLSGGGLPLPGGGLPLPGGRFPLPGGGLPRGGLGDIGQIITLISVINQYSASSQQRSQAAEAGEKFRHSPKAQEKFAAAKKTSKVRYVAVKVKKDPAKSKESKEQGTHVMLVNPATGKPKSDKVYVVKSMEKSGSAVDIDGQKAMVYSG